MNEPGQQRPAGWFPDPLGRFDHRYFNGSNWTADVADGGERRVDPLGTTPGGGSPAGGPGAARRGNTAATVAVVFGVIGVLLAWMPIMVVLGSIAAVVALIAGFKARRHANDGAEGGGKATVGLVLGGFGLALAVVGVILTVIVVRATLDYVDPGRHDVTVAECVLSDGSASVTGTLLNESNQRRSYTVHVTVDYDADRSTTVEVAELSGLEPDAEREWVVTTNDAPPDGDCDATADVFGPFPFDVPMEAPE